MILVQRVLAVLMAAAMVFAFLVPLALQRHDGPLAVGIVAIFVLYLAVNAWLFVRAHRARTP